MKTKNIKTLCSCFLQFYYYPILSSIGFLSYVTKWVYKRYLFADKMRRFDLVGWNPHIPELNTHSSQKYGNNFGTDEWIDKGNRTSVVWWNSRTDLRISQNSCDKPIKQKTLGTQTKIAIREVGIPFEQRVSNVTACNFLIVKSKVGEY